MYSYKHGDNQHINPIETTVLRSKSQWNSIYGSLTIRSITTAIAQN